MKLINESLLTIKKSKFYSYYYSINSSEEAEEIIKKIKEENKKAKHVCFAYKVGNIAKRTDDKEPKGSAGDPILSVLDKNNINNSLIVVVRYFGGTLLGKGLLTRTYVQAALDCLSQQEN